MSLAEELKKNNIKPLVALNGKDALELGKENEIKVIVCDINLNDTITGLEAAQTIKKFKKEFIPIVVVSAYPTKNIELNTEGVVGFIKKPYDIETVSRVIKILVEN